MSNTRRTRNYATIIYPESSPNFLEKLKSEMIPAFVSPLHDKDLDKEGNLKKEHYHVMIMFDSVKTKEQAKEVIDRIGGVGCEVINSVKGYARYLCHMDETDKVQYNIEEVISLFGADYMKMIDKPVDRYKAIAEMIDFCEDNDIISFAELIRWTRKNKFEWFRVLCDSGTIVIEKYLKSKGWEQGKNRLLD